VGRWGGVLGCGGGGVRAGVGCWVVVGCGLWVVGWVLLCFDCEWGSVVWGVGDVWCVGVVWLVFGGLVVWW